MDIYQMTDTDFEELADTVKRAVIQALVNENVLEFNFADKWCSQHTVIKRKKGFFKTLSSLWSKEKEEKDSFKLLVVSLSKKNDTQALNTGKESVLLNQIKEALTPFISDYMQKESNELNDDTTVRLEIACKNGSSNVVKLKELRRLWDLYNKI